MAHVFFSYPDGRVGLALILMRASLAILILSNKMVLLPAVWWALSSLVLSVALGLGFGVRVTAGLCALAFMAMAWPLGDMASISTLASALNALALALLGPGSFSLDALAFGRRTVRF